MTTFRPFRALIESFRSPELLHVIEKMSWSHLTRGTKPVVFIYRAPGILFYRIPSVHLHDDLWENIQILTFTRSCVSTKTCRASFIPGEKLHVWFQLLENDDFSSSKKVDHGSCFSRNYGPKNRRFRIVDDGSHPRREVEVHTSQQSMSSESRLSPIIWKTERCVDLH